MLTDKYDIGFLQAHLAPLAQWRPYPPASDRVAWDALWEDPRNRERKAYVIGGAEMIVGTPWPELPATLYMDYIRTGRRGRYDRPYRLRRSRLARLVLAECMEYRGRFLDEIINGIWLITEEATWAVPPHATRDRLGDDVDPLPKQGEDTPELASLQTPVQLGQTLYLLGGALDSISPAVRERIRRQCLSRMIEPFEDHHEDYFSWMDGHNNWTPYCCLHMLRAAMYLLADTGRLARVTQRLMKGVDRFIAQYGADGGCNEGPSYWSMAAGAMFGFLEQLHERSGGAITIYDEPLIREMGLYITRAHLAGPWFANFADARARLSPPREVIYNYGQRVGSQRMKDFAAVAGNWAPPESPYAASVEQLFHPIELPTLAVSDYRHEPEVWLPDLQVMITRDTAEAGRGIVCAAKAGHNNENHNHNDIGQFIIVLDGDPIVVDIGPEQYNRTTFSKQRYTLWTFRSSGHDVPMVNGFEQSPGRFAVHDRQLLAALKATDVSYRSDESRRVLGMNMERAYPPEAGIVSLRREIVHESGETPSVSVTDDVEVKAGPVELAVPLYTPHAPELPAPGAVQMGAGNRRLRLHYDPSTVSCTAETIDLTDPGLRSIWGPVLHKVLLRHRTPEPRTSMTLRFAVDG